MVTEQRWKQAQEYELLHWKKVADRIASGSEGQLSWYEWVAGEMEKRLLPHFTEDQKKDARVLEVGSGPIGIVTFLKWGERYTIDPLEDFYQSNPALSDLRDSTVHYGQGTGEKLPFKDNFFSIVILVNVLDHVHNAEGVLNEIYRVLANNGILYFAVNVHTSWGAFLHNILAKLLIDRGHPYTFTGVSIRDFILRHKFNILSESADRYLKAKEQNLKSGALKDKIKGYSGLSEFFYYAVCSKKVE